MANIYDVGDLVRISATFQVSDTDEVCRRVRAAGYRTYSDPQDLRGGVTRPVYVEGPEGVVVEFLEIRG